MWLSQQYPDFKLDRGSPHGSAVCSSGWGRVGGLRSAQTAAVRRRPAADNLAATAVLFHRLRARGRGEDGHRKSIASSAGSQSDSRNGAVMRIDLVDPPAFSPPMTRPLASAMAALGGGRPAPDVRVHPRPVPEPVGFTSVSSSSTEGPWPPLHGARRSAARLPRRDMRRYRREAP